MKQPVIDAIPTRPDERTMLKRTTRKVTLPDLAAAMDAAELSVMTGEKIQTAYGPRSYSPGVAQIDKEGVGLHALALLMTGIVSSRLAYSPFDSDYEDVPETLRPGLLSVLNAGRGESIELVRRVLNFNVTIGREVVIGENVTIGDGTTIKAGVVIESNVIIGENAWVGNGVRIRKGSRLPDGTILHGAGN